MRKKIFFAAITAFFVISPVVWAHPPAKIELTYDQSKKVIHIEIEHVTSHMRVHFIRRITITKNNETPIDIYLTKQTTGKEVIQDVPLEAKPGDTIRVRAESFESGYGEETLTVPEEQKSPEKQ